MSFVKYALSKTGLFPKWEPQITDVMNAADLVFEIHRAKGDYYIVPAVLHRRDILKLMRIFRDNGVFLRPHNSRHFSCFVLRVPIRNQKFIKRVISVKQDSNNFQKLLAEYNTSTKIQRRIFQNMFNKKTK